MIKPDRKGVCTNCEEEYEGNAPENDLYSISGRVVCGECANMWKAEEEAYEYAYGE